VKKLRHSWLFAALTIMLGVAVLTSTLAAPAMRVVLSAPTAVLEQNIAKQSARGLAGILPPFDSVPPLDSAALSGPALFEVADTRDGGWMADEVVNVFTISQKQTEVRNPIYDAAVDALHWLEHPLAAGGSVFDVREGTTRLVHPGAEGTYEFAVQNTQSFPIEWRLRIMEENDSATPIPMLYRLRSGVDYLVGSAVTWEAIPAAGIVYPVEPDPMKPLASMASEPFILEWQWDIGATDAEDLRDTEIGDAVADAISTPALMPYYRLHFNLYAEAEEVFTIIWNYADPVTGALVERDRWVINGEDLGKTIGELMALYGFAGMPAPPDFPDQEFQGWRDKDGVEITDGYAVTSDKLVIGADGSEMHILGKYNPVRVGPDPDTFTIIWYYTDPITGELIEWDRWFIKEEDLGKTIGELMDIYGFSGMPPPPEFPGYRFLGWRDRDGVEIVPGYVITKDKLVMGVEGFEMYMEILGKYNSTGSTILPPWVKPSNILPFLPLIPIVGLLPLIPLVALLPLIPLVPAALLLPFLPGWIGKLLPGPGTPPVDSPPYVKPPHTGDDVWNLAPVYLLLAVSTGMVIIFSKKRKKDEQDA